jgi:hypothetical protein
MDGLETDTLTIVGIFCFTAREIPGGRGGGEVGERWLTVKVSPMLKVRASMKGGRTSEIYYIWKHQIVFLLFVTAFTHHR